MARLSISFYLTSLPLRMIMLLVTLVSVCLFLCLFVCLSLCLPFFSRSRSLSHKHPARLSDSRQKQRPPSQTSLSSVNESLPSSPVSLCEGQAVKSDISRRGRSLKIRAGAEVCSMEKSLEVSNVTRRGLVRNTSCPAGVATSPSSSLTGGEAFSDFDLDCSDDEIPGEDDEKEICSQTDTRDASALVVTQVRRCTIRGRTSTLPR